MFVQFSVKSPTRCCKKNTTACNKKWAWQQYKNLGPFHSSVIFVVVHPLYLPLAAAINQNLKVIVRKGINVENKEFQCISFADDVTCFLHHKKPDVGQFLTAHIRMMNAQDLSSLNNNNNGTCIALISKIHGASQ